MDLPDEILENILQRTDPITLIRCRRVNKRLWSITHRDILLRSFPHHILREGEYSLKILNDEVYSNLLDRSQHKRSYVETLMSWFGSWLNPFFGSAPSPGLSPRVFLDVLRADTVDLAWIHAKTSKLVQNSGLSRKAWNLLRDILHVNSAGTRAMHDYRYPSWCYYDYPGPCMRAIMDAIIIVAKDYFITFRDINRYLFDPKLGLDWNNPLEIAKKTHLITECLILCSIDEALCRKIYDICTELGPIPNTLADF